MKKSIVINVNIDEDKLTAIVEKVIERHIANITKRVMKRKDIKDTILRMWLDG